MLDENTLKKLSRRRFVQLGSGLTLTGLLAACGDNTSTVGSSGGSPAVSTTATGATTAATTSTATTSATSAATTSAATTSATTTVAAVTGPLKAIKYALPTAFILSYVEAFIAKEGKFWEKEGLDVTLVAGSGTASSLQQVTTKTAFAARGGAITTIINRTNQNLPIRSIYAIYRGVQFVIITDDKGTIKTPADMKGKSVGVVSRGGSTEQLLTLILAGASVKKDDWNPVVVGASTGAYAFLTKGDVVAFTATNHVAVELQHNKQPIKVLPISDFLKVPSDDVIVHQDLIQDDPDTVTKVVRGLQNARKWAQDPANLDKILTYCQPYTPDEIKNAEVAKLKIQDDIKQWTGAASSLKLGQIDRTGWTNLQDQLQASGFIQKKLDLSELIDTSFIDKVEP